MGEGIRVAAVDDIAEGDAVAVPSEVTGTSDDIAILRDEDGTFYALNDTCTHEEASLAEGWIEEGYVECPRHASRFRLSDGGVVGLPATRDTQAHRVEVRDGEVFLYPGEAPRR